MTTRLHAWGAFAARHRRAIAVGTLLFAIFAGLWGTRAVGGFTGGAGFDDPHSDSTRADAILTHTLGRHTPDVTVVYDSASLTVDQPQFASTVRAAVARAPRADVTDIRSYWSDRDPALVSRDRHATYVTIGLKPSDDQARVTALEKIESDLRAPAGSGLTTRFGGVTAMTEQVNAHVGKDIGRAELISIPVLLLLMLFVFRSLVATALPLAVGGVVALGSFVVLRIVESFTTVSSFAINVITILGLGLAIDYALLLISRFRREIRATDDVDAAVGATVASAGRTVLFSGLAVAISFAGLTVFPSRFLSSLGYAAAAVTVFAVLGSLILLPALLRFAGKRIDALRVPSLRRKNSRPDETRRRYYRHAHRVMRRPVAGTVLGVAVLAVLALPLLRANWARPSDWVLPSSADARVVTHELGNRFATDPNKQLTAVLAYPDGTAASGRDEITARYARRLADVPGVTSAAVTGASGRYARISLGYTEDPMSRAAVGTVHQLRAIAPPTGARMYLTGMPASRVDITAMIGRGTPWMIGFIAVVTFALLAFAFGSLLLPLIALALNGLTLLATLGVMTWIFQDGHLAGLLGVSPIGAIDANFPVLIVAVGFGLATDYEAFLISRIREARQHGAADTEAIALGLQRSAGIITSAAVLLCAVVLGFAFSSISFLTMIGVGLIVQVLLDATLVRLVLIPATTRMLGRHAWWTLRRRARTPITPTRDTLVAAGQR